MAQGRRRLCVHNAASDERNLARPPSKFLLLPPTAAARRRVHPAPHTVVVTPQSLRSTGSWRGIAQPFVRNGSVRVASAVRA
jgi:hypothetical protein